MLTFVHAFPHTKFGVVGFSVGRFQGWWLLADTVTRSASYRRSSVSGKQASMKPAFSSKEGLNACLFASHQVMITPFVQMPSIDILLSSHGVAEWCIDHRYNKTAQGAGKGGGLS